MIQNLLFQRPELSHIEDEDSDAPIFVTVQGRKGIVFQTKFVDLEASEREAIFKLYEEILSRLPFGVLARVKLQSESCFKSDGIESRVETIRSEGYRKKILFLSLEWNQSLKIIKSDLPLELLSELGFSVEKEQLFLIFKDELNEISQNKQSVDFGDSLKGVYRIYQPGNDPLDWASLASQLSQIPSDFELTVTMTRIPPGQSETKLKQKITKDKMKGDSIALEKVQASEEMLRSISLYGNSLFEIEWLIVVDRKSEFELRTALTMIQNGLGKFGQGAIEKFAPYRSIVASMFGASQHVTFKENCPIVFYYLPITCFGEARDDKYLNKRTLLLHRDDWSIHKLDIFHPSFKAFNMVIGGTSGAGKSVFGNALSRAILNDPAVSMIKVDVGGSYRRECSLYNGKEISFNLNTPSGVDPFRLVNDVNNKNDVASILVGFLCSLAREQDERIVSKETKSDFEFAVKNFLEKFPGEPFGSFVEKNPDIPRIKLLRRWGKGGIYENALLGTSGDDLNNRYVYYNFESIHNASDEDFSSGIMAAVIARVNIEIIKLSTCESRAQQRRLVFFCDELKFFVEKNADFFLLTTANFRKFGHSIILAIQDLSTLVLNKNGKDEEGILSNSPIKVFFPQCGTKKFLDEHLNLNESLIESIVNPPVAEVLQEKNYREFILQDNRGTRKVKLQVTPEEYFSMTSTRDEVDKINQIEAALPGLKTKDIIRLIVLNGGLSK